MWNSALLPLLLLCSCSSQSSPFAARYHLCGSGLYDPSAPLLRDGVWHLFEDRGGWSHYTSIDLLHWKAAAGTHFGGMTGSIAVTETGTYALYPDQHRKGVFKRSAALDSNLTRWGPSNTVVPLPAGVTNMQDPARAIKLRDGSWYVLGACDIRGTSFVGFCLFRAIDSTLQSFVPATGGVDRDGLFFTINSTFGAIDVDGVFHNSSYPLYETDVGFPAAGCPDLFPIGDKYGLLITYGGKPSAGHMQEQWWVGDIINNTFSPLQTDLADYGNYFAAKTGSTDQQSGEARRVMFGFPGWTQTTRPKAAPTCLNLPRDLSLGANGRIRQAPIPEMSHLRSQRWDEGALPTGSQIEVRLSCKPAGRVRGAVGIDVLATTDRNQFTRVAYDFDHQQLLVDQRACCGSFPGNGIVQTAPISIEPGEDVELVVFVDGYMVETFFNNRTVITTLVSPDAAVTPPEARRAFLYNTANVTCELEGWKLALESDFKSPETIIV